MQRRGFLGLLAGTVAAAPVAAKNVLTNAAPLSGSAYAGLATSLDELGKDAGYGYATSIGSSGWKIDRIERLRRLISGEEQEEETDVRPRLRMVEHNINALGSVSPASKVRMFRSAVKTVQKEQQKRSWLQEIMHLETEDDF